MAQTHTTQETLIPLQTSLWNEFAEIVSRQGKRPMRVAAQLFREYIEIQQDLALFEEMRRDARGRIKSDEEAVEFVRQIRREKRLGPNGSRAKSRVRQHRKPRIS